MNQLFVAILSGLVFYLVLSFSTKLSKKERLMLVFASLLFALIGYSLYTLLSFGLLIVTLVVLTFSGGFLIYALNKRNIERSRTEEIFEEIEAKLASMDKLEVEETNTITSEIDRDNFEVKEENDTTVHKHDVDDIQIDKDIEMEETFSESLDPVSDIVETSLEETTESQVDMVEEESVSIEENQEDSPDEKSVEDSIEENLVLSHYESNEVEQEDKLDETLLTELEVAAGECIEEAEKEITEDFENLIAEGLMDEVTFIEKTSEETDAIEDSVEPEIDDTKVEPSEQDLEEIEEGLEEEVEQQDLIEEQTELPKEIRPIDRSVLQLLLDQLEAYKPILSQSDYETLLIQHVKSSLHHQDYYIFASLLRDFYLETSEWEKLNSLLTQLLDDFKNYPIIKEEILFLKEKYNK